MPLQVSKEGGRGRFHTHTHPCLHQKVLWQQSRKRFENWSDVATNHGMPEVAKLEEVREQSCLEREHGTAHIFIFWTSGFQNCERIKFSYIKPPSCYDSPRKLTLSFFCYLSKQTEISQTQVLFTCLPELTAPRTADPRWSGMVIRITPWSPLIHWNDEKFISQRKSVFQLCVKK